MVNKPGLSATFVRPGVRDHMVQRFAAIACAAALLSVVATRRQTVVAQSAAVPSPTPQRVLLDRYCVACHNQRARAAGQEPARKLTLDDLDPARVSEHPDKWELVVRKLRAGMMPPAGSRRPDKAAYDGFITWLENELDRTAVV